MFVFNEKIVLKKFLANNSYAFLLSSISITFVVWAIQAVNNLDIVAEDGHSFLIYFYYTLLAFPKIFSDLLPIIFFTSLFYTIIKYENNNELKIFLYELKYMSSISKQSKFNEISIAILFFYHYCICSLFFVSRY